MLKNKNLVILGVGLLLIGLNVTKAEATSTKVQLMQRGSIVGKSIGEMKGYVKGIEVKSKPKKKRKKKSIKQQKEEELKRRIKAGEVLNSYDGVFWFDGHKETYYNLNMSKVVEIMRDKGYKKEKYWVRDDGVKMFGDYVMVAANTKKYKKGTIVETSLGTGMVVDCCASACSSSYDWFDIAVDW